jgi:hypothetical protein
LRKKDRLYARHLGGRRRDALLVVLDVLLERWHGGNFGLQRQHSVGVWTHAGFEFDRFGGTPVSAHLKADNSLLDVSCPSVLFYDQLLFHVLQLQKWRKSFRQRGHF